MSKIETLNDLIEQHTQVAVENFKRDGELLQVIIGYSGNKRYLIPLNFSSDSEKELSLRMVTVFFAAYNVDRYTFATEAYALKLPDKEMEEAYAQLQREGKRISEHPASAEVVIISAVSYTEKKIVMFDICEDRTLKKYNENAEAAGRFTELLPPKDIPKEAREEAKAAIEWLQIPFTEDIIQ